MHFRPIFQFVLSGIFLFSLPLVAEEKEPQEVEQQEVEANQEEQKQEEQKQEEQKPQPRVSYSVSPGFVQFLHDQNISIGVTSYQSGMLYLIGRNPKGGVLVNQQNFRQAMGLHPTENGFLMAGLDRIYRMENILRPGQAVEEVFSHCFLPRTSHFTGALFAHDVGLTKEGEILFVNTHYNCIATLSEKDSFKEYWRPFFISRLIGEDRCHLNGLAMRDGEAAFVTAVCKSDTIDGWRDRRGNGGIVVDVQKNKVICSGLSMPHSPRIHDGKLWVLNAGTGELGTVENYETGEGTFKPVCFCPGFLRGLSLHGRYAVVGLSKPRYERFEGLDLDRRLEETDSEAWCGIQVIDTTTGQCVHWFRIDGAITELYDVAFLPGVFSPRAVSPLTDEAISLITIEEEPETMVAANAAD